MRLVAYCRVSTDDGQNPERQRDVLEGAAARRGDDIVAWFIDEGTSGGVPPLERIQVGLAIKKAKDAGADGIIVESVDRWTRCGPLDFFSSSAILELRHHLKLVLADVPQGMDGMAYEIYASIMAIVSKAFRERLREQIRSGLARARKEGWKNGQPGRRPKPNLAPHEVAYVREQKALGRRGAGWGRMSLELTRRRGALEVVDRKARENRTVTPSWLRMEWYRIERGSMVRNWRPTIRDAAFGGLTPAVADLHAAGLAPNAVGLQAAGLVAQPANIAVPETAGVQQTQAGVSAAPVEVANGSRGVELHG